MQELTQKEFFKNLFILYENSTDAEKVNYDEKKRTGTIRAKIKPLRTVVHRAVEFYVSKLNVPFQISSKNQAVVDAIQDFYKFSNFNSIKPVLIRNFSLYGNLFVKVLGNSERVWCENIPVEHISDFSCDSRGYLQSIRIDVPIIENERRMTYTEFWDKDHFAIWRHLRGENVKLEQLSDGELVDSGFLPEIGSDNFIPIVFTKFKDVGTKWGFGTVNHALSKIEEANKQADRISDLLYQYEQENLIAITAPIIKKDEKPAPPIPIKDLPKNAISVGGGAKVESLANDANFESMITVLDKTMEELVEDIPALKAYRLGESGNLSGEALKQILSGAVSTSEEGLENFKSCMLRVNEIGMTIGSFWGLFPNLSGTYEQGSFEHEIITPELFPMSDKEKATLVKEYTASGMALATALELAGFDEEFINKAIEKKDLESSKSQANFMTQFNQV